jgi:hypothetical protein
MPSWRKRRVSGAKRLWQPRNRGGRRRRQAGRGLRDQRHEVARFFERHAGKAKAD